MLPNLRSMIDADREQGYDAAPIAWYRAVAAYQRAKNGFRSDPRLKGLVNRRYRAMSNTSPYRGKTHIQVMREAMRMVERG